MKRAKVRLRFIRRRRCRYRVRISYDRLRHQYRAARPSRIFARAWCQSSAKKGDDRYATKITAGRQTEALCCVGEHHPPEHERECGAITQALAKDSLAAPPRSITDLFSFIECAKRTHSTKALFDLLVSCASEEGFSEVAYGALTAAESLRLQYLPPAETVNFPSGWCQRYSERKYRVIDPVVRRAPMLSRPFLWDQLGAQYQLQRGEQRVLDEAKDAGLKHGISIPLFGPSGQLSVMSFASSSEDADPQNRMSRLSVLAWNFHVAFAEIAPPSESACDGKIRLSEREKECLRWGAEGKSSWEIGMILKVSENTVNFHVKNAIQTLDASNRTHAIVKAIRLNLI
ncbi:autoinducer binding domain-containing protein [Bradyrhizobium sp. Tv2a-2]|uniref:autoinducer binding domain-containing protein n=1 Tax=Bradyrhizobium sp. Tv2a-2 TaxID=113395 RepID=UPI0009FD1CC9